MPTTALVLYAVYVVVAFGLRVLIQVRRTGTTGLHGLGRRSGATEWSVGIGFAVAALLGIAAPVLALQGRVEPIASLDTSLVHGLGIALALLGIAATFGAQLAMGRSWRIGVDPEERTALVTSGIFRIARNPIYTAVLATALGLALLVPSWVAIAGLASLFLVLELQVRVVEEPYLLRVHGDAFADYAARVGRFVPGVGRINIPA